MMMVGYSLLGVAGLFLGATYLLQWGIPKEHRRDPEKYKLDEKKRRRITWGYYCTFGFLFFAALGGVLIAQSL